MVFSIFTTIISLLSLSHAIFSTKSTSAFPFSLPVCVYVSLSKMHHPCGLENCSRKRMRRKSFHVDMSSPNRIAASADGLEWLQCIFFLLDYFANVLCFSDLCYCFHYSFIWPVLYLLMLAESQKCPTLLWNISKYFGCLLCLCKNDVPHLVTWHIIN